MPISDVDAKKLIENGVHFGTRSSRWNPKMKPYIHSKRKGIHIIDLRETLKGLFRAWHYIAQVSSKGKGVLFVGTKRQAQDAIRQEAQRANAYFVAHRWLGGTLTNMRTMRNRIVRLEELEGLEASGEIQNFSKKMIAALTRERRNIFRNFEGIRGMKELPGALVVVDPSNEDIALHEAVKLDIPVVAITDTDCDPDPVDFIIPANDDSIRSIGILLQHLADAVIEGRKKAGQEQMIAQRAAETPETAPVEEKGIENVPEDFTAVGGFSYGGDESEEKEE